MIQISGERDKTVYLLLDLFVTERKLQVLYKDSAVKPFRPMRLRHIPFLTEETVQ
jgi:hypothetical protein